MALAIVIDIVLILIFAGAVYSGVKRGLIKSVAGLLSFVGGWLCADRLSFVLDGILKRHIFLPMATKYVASGLQSAVQNMGAQMEAEIGALMEKASALIGMLSAIGLFPADAAEDPSRLIPGGIDTEALTARLTSELAEPLADKMSAIAAYLILFVVGYILFRVIFYFADLVSRLPVLNQVNKTMGAVMGLVLGVAYTFLAAKIISLVLGILCANGTLPTEIQVGFIYRLFTGGLF
ncbi:MAG: CvpA family protein [Clostridia bacterium]|nr:CvpA family protein [Clostridia bacterium]